MIYHASIQSIQLQWILPKAYGSTSFLRQVLRWKLQNEEIEKSIELDCETNEATVPGILSYGIYKISLDSYFSIKINLEDESDESSRKEIRLTTTETTPISFQVPGLAEKPEVYLTGYTTSTIDLTWNKPNMFTVIEHPEKLNESIKIHRNLLAYRVEVNGQRYNTLAKDKYQCTLTECKPGEEYKVQLVVQTAIQAQYINDIVRFPFH